MQDTHSVQIRDMRSGEEKALLGEARQAFIHSPLEQLGISKPKFALVAEVDGAIAGAMFLRMIGTGENKTGYLDVGFIKKGYRGLGLAKTLYPAAIQRLREFGCDCVCAQVLDDNAASWKPLQNQGFSTPTLAGMVKRMGLGRAISCWFQTLYCIACGSRLWMDGPAKERGSGKEFASFLCVNLLLFLPRLIQLTAQPEQLLSTALAYLAVLFAGVFFGGIGCLVAGGEWRFAFPRGGALLTLLLNAVGVTFPMVGRW